MFKNVVNLCNLYNVIETFPIGYAQLCWWQVVLLCCIWIYIQKEAYGSLVWGMVVLFIAGQMYVGLWGTGMLEGKSILGMWTSCRVQTDGIGVI